MSRLVLLATLGALVFLSGLGVVLSRHEARKAFVELQRQEAERDALNEEWSRLQLEQATWATHGRVEELASSRLDMRRPEGDALMVVTP